MTTESDRDVVNATQQTDEGTSDEREQIACEIEAHAEYSNTYKPAPEFLVGLSTAAEVVRMGGCCPATTAARAVVDAVETEAEKRREFCVCGHSFTAHRNGLIGPCREKGCKCENFTDHPGTLSPSPARDEKATLTDELWLIRNSKTGQWFMGSVGGDDGIWAPNIAMSVVYTSPKGGPIYGLPEDGEWVRFAAHMAAPDELTAALASRNLARARQDEIADERDALRERVDALTTAARLITEDPGMNCHPGYEALRALLGHA